MSDTDLIARAQVLADGIAVTSPHRQTVLDLIAALEAKGTALTAATEAIRNAPHSEVCALNQPRPGGAARYLPVSGRTCDCWRSRALAATADEQETP